MRRSARDVVAERQRLIFGVDGLERQIADCTSLLLRMLEVSDPASKDNVHFTRAAEWLLRYEETQRAEWNLGEVSDGSAKAK